MKDNHARCLIDELIIIGQAQTDMCRNLRELAVLQDERITNLESALLRTTQQMLDHVAPCALPDCHDAPAPAEGGSA